MDSETGNIVQFRGRTASPQHSAKCVVKRPTTEAEYRELLAFASSPAPEPEPATTEQLSRHLEFMAAVLPSKGVDADTGRKRSAVYAAILGDRTNAALAFMARRACETLDWMPTPRQCLEILRDYIPPADARSTALRLCQDYQHDRFETWAENVRAGQPIGDVPDQWLRIGIEQGFLRRLDDDSVVSRALYQGPLLPVAGWADRLSIAHFLPADADAEAL